MGRKANDDQAARFWARVDKTERCWLWLGAIDKTRGYGQVYWSGATKNAHVVAYELIYQRSPTKRMSNLCGHTACVNPAHWRTGPVPKMVVPRRASAADRLLARIAQVQRVESFTPCWEWLGRLDANGYARVRINGVPDYAHRHTYRLWRGEIPAGMEIDHLCRNRGCCNPDHLEAVTHRENLRRSPIHPFFNPEMRYTHRPRPPRTHCCNGHPQTPENLYTLKDGKQRCAVCAREHSRRRHEQTYDPDRQREKLARRHAADPGLRERERARARDYYHRRREGQVA